eukprot:TRINITY_DN2092_c0_g1_i2.p1 TRINITY_DN2092_c0_g1~~TRINITY_DN2092_c0_g1_i2.p1  ORF type:complete len:648 (-),score=245.09 TRINITY_DN2092_c0_g1_i2:107-2050(-)
MAERTPLLSSTNNKESRLTVPGMTTSFRMLRNPLTLTWENVNYIIPQTIGCLPGRRKVVEKQILFNVSGCVKPGELLAIMGSTGAGKSTMLDVLCDRKKRSMVSGEILLNGQDRTDSFTRLAAYVTQDDCLLPNLTVRETFRFYADIKLPQLTKAEREIKVDLLIEELGLEKVANSRIGSQFRRGISGGEKKRVSIGCELITDPGLIFLDEPTTGLDSFNSLSVMETLRKLATKGHTIVCTIHQPRASIFELFDKLLLLSAGKIVYFGETKQAIDYFSELGYSCGSFNNPADFFIDVIVSNEKVFREQADGEFKGKSINSVGHEKELTNEYKQSKLQHETVSDIREANITFSRNANGDAQLPIQAKYASPFFRQVFYLTKRSFTNMVRDPLATYISVCQGILMSCILGSIYFGIQKNMDQSEIQNITGALFFVMTNVSFSCFAIMNIFIKERGVMNRERASGTYSTGSYFVSKNIVDMTFQMINPLFFGTIAYWFIGFDSDPAKFGIFLALILLFNQTAGSMLMFIGCFAPTLEVATILSPVLNVIFLLFGGFFINPNSIPVYYSWIKYISFFKYGYQVLCINEFQDATFCTDDPVPVCNITGNEILDKLGMADSQTIGECFAILFVILIVYRSMAFTSLVFLNRQT